MRPGFPRLLIMAMLALTPVFAEAQQSAKVPRVGYLNTHLRTDLRGSTSVPNWPRRLIEPFRDGLRELGYVDGQNIVVEARAGDESQMSGLAAELVRLKVDVIVAQPDAIHGAMTATSTIPIVAVFSGDPVHNGFVTSLDRPGGNVTGVGALTLELGGKWLELIKDTVPSARRVAVFWNRRAEEAFPVWKSLDAAARSLGIEIQWLESRRISQATVPSLNKAGARSFDRNLGTALKGGDAFVVLPGVSDLARIAGFGLKNRIPGIFWRADLDMDEMHGLMAYGVSRFEQSRRAAYFVNKLLRGVKPAELPVELPKSFEFVINVKAAKEIGITIPPRVIAWADRVVK